MYLSGRKALAAPAIPINNINNRYDCRCDKYYTRSDFTIATLFIKKEKAQRCKENNNTNNMLCDRSVYFVTNNFIAVFFLRRFLRRRIMVKIPLNNSLTLYAPTSSDGW